MLALEGFEKHDVAKFVLAFEGFEKHDVAKFVLAFEGYRKHDSEPSGCPLNDKQSTL